MLGKSVVTQIRLLVNQKGAIFTFYSLLALCLMNFINNVQAFQGYDLIEMYHPMKMLLLSYNRIYYNADATLFLIQLYPFLLVCPAGFSILLEQQTKRETLVISRTNSSVFYFSKVIASFIVTSMVFILPFLVEMVLTCVSFPLGASGDFMNMGNYSVEYIESVHNYLFWPFFVKAPYLYVFFCIILFGMITGLLGTVVVVFTTLINVKYKVLLFVPIYVLLNATLYMEKFFPRLSTNWYNYLLIFHDETKNLGYYLISLLICILFIIYGTLYSSKKERIR